MTLAQVSKSSIFYAVVMLVFTVSFFLIGSLRKISKMNTMNQPKKNTEASQPIRIAFRNTHLIPKIDPAKIEVDYEYNFLENIYSTLFRFDEGGVATPFLAQNYHWNDNSLHIQIRADARTSKGQEITPGDAELSIKRIAQLASNSHGPISLILEAVSSTPNELILKVRKKEYRSILIQLLCSVDFVITKNGELNHLDSTGPFYLFNEDTKKIAELRANPFHWLYKQIRFKTIQLYNLDPIDSINALQVGEIDFVPSNNAGMDNAFDLVKRGKFGISKTLPILKMYIAPSPSKKLHRKPLEHLHIMLKVKEAVFKRGTHWTDTIDFFPVLGEGSLSKAQQFELRTLYDKARVQPSKPHKNVTLGISKVRFAEMSAILGNIDGIELVKFDRFPGFESPENQPDYYMTGTDTAFFESLSLLSYYFSCGLFLPLGQSPESLLNRYISLSEKADRIALLNELVFETLKEGNMLIIGENTYVTLFNKKFSYDGERYFASSLFWRIGDAK